MKRKEEIFLFVLSFFVISFIPAAVECIMCKKKMGNFPKPGSFCRSYYKCVNWKAIEMKCPEDQHFFPSKGYCVWPEVYACLERPRSKECPQLNGKFLKPGTECKVYYDCCNGKPTEKKCPEDSVFDHSKGKCEYPELYTCEDGFKVCQQPNGKFLKPGTACKVYYDCNNGNPTEMKCPKDLIFDHIKGICEWPELYICNDAVSTTKTSRTRSTTPTVSTTDSSEETDSASSSEEHWKTTSITSNSDSSEEETTLYTAESQTTPDFKNNSTPNTPEWSTPPVTISVSVRPKEEKISTLNIYSTTNSKHNLSTHNISNSSMDVFNTTVSINAAKTTINFNTRSKELVKYSTTVSGDLTVPVTADIYCPKPNGYFPHPTDRHKFIGCVGGDPRILTCPEDLVYKHELGLCDYDNK